MVLGSLVPSSPLANVVVILLTTGLIWVGSGWLEESADHLAAYYGLPAVVQGSIIVALGSSFPEFASVAIAATAGVFDMGVGAIVGSAIFNILVIPALSGLATDGDLETSRLVVYKEAQFYMVAVATLVVTFSLAVIYFPAPDGPALTGELTRPVALIPLLLYGLYLFIQWQDVSEYEAEDAGVADGIGREWVRLLGGLLVILIGVEQLVGSVESLSGTFGVPTFLAGVTIVAAATSLPDTLVSVRSAADGNSATSLGNVLGSNTFDLLVAIPVGVLIVGSVPVDFAVAVPMLGVLTLATVLLFGLLRTDLSLSRVECYVLGAAYLVFVGWIIAETAGVTSLLRN
ncbi:sodium:calcium antiporter [Haloferax sp. Atlit-12N]|uniref:sodium:calcium antiporter n=1 Tax=Haloferax sp. Atlit-12N TaxID=2077203 RepID=UPI000E24DD91|nr:sodium:calcium antiporter [Haloferax sp. Atlit-12N]RDZ63953.1 sodium:calcium antiporter [Haloferax sp. Atlit-12N]